MKFLLLIFLFFSCSLQKSKNAKSIYINLNVFFHTKANKSDILKHYDKPENINSEFLDYASNESYKRLRINLKSNLVQSILLVLNKDQFTVFKNDLSCNWFESKKLKNSVHYIDYITIGECKENQVTYEQDGINNSYIIKWIQ